MTTAHSSSISSSSSLISLKSSNPQQKHVHSSFNVSDLIKAESIKPFHLGKPCKPLTELIITKRNGKSLHRWKRIKNAPPYFKCVEKNSGIFKMYRQEKRAMAKVVQEGKPKKEVNRFKVNLFQKALQPNILRYIDSFSTCNYNLYKIMEEFLNDRRSSIFKKWVPVGIDGGSEKLFSELPTIAIKELHTIAVKGTGFSFGGNAAISNSITGVQTYNSTCEIIKGDDLLKNVFNLSEASIKLIREKKSTLLREVHKKCKQYEVARLFRSDEVYIGEHEDVLEIKIGVYFVPAKGKVYKFLCKPINFPDFYSEVSVGLYIEHAIKGICGITSVCPEHFCFEMRYCGPNLYTVIRSNHLESDKKTKEVCVYDVIMMQSTPGQFNVPLQSGLLKEVHKNSIIRDSKTAFGILSIFRNKILDELPFFLGELINIVTRLGQQGLVNLDIKADNFVIDGCTGQPKMIDLNIILPSGHKKQMLPNMVFTSSAAENSPQTPPEYPRGQRCFETSMSFSLAHTLKHILKTLSQSGDFAASSLHMNMEISEWIAKAYSEKISDRPEPHLVAMYIGSAFPFEKKIKDLFLKPKHIITC